MKGIYRSLLIVLAALTVPSGLIHAQVPFWRAELEGRPAQALVGTEVYLTLELENTSGRDLWMAQTFGWTNSYCRVGIEGPDGESNASECISGYERTADLPLPTFRTKRLYRAEETVSLTNFSFMPRCPGRYSASYWCHVPAEALNPERNGKTGKIETNDEVWQGSFQSNVVTVTVVEPKGIDKEAYEAFGRNPLGDSGRYGELLSRFPTSTYAAYVIWSKYAKGWAGVETGRAVGALELGFKHEEGFLPCTKYAVPSAAAETLLSGPVHVECRDAWLDVALENRPSIWFADEIRLKLALDRYLLGDKDACATGLEDLAEHGKPYVASKAGELISAMKAKGMLQEKEK